MKEETTILLLDYDMTLAHTPNLGECVQNAFKEQGVKVGKEFLEKFHAHNFTGVLKDEYPLLDRNQFKRAIACYEKNTAHKLYDGIKEALQCWHELGTKLFLFSARDEYSLGCRLEHDGIRSYFQVICTSDDYAPLSKKDMGSMERILQFLRDNNICADNLWYVGDSIIDWASASNHGLREKFRAVIHGNARLRDLLIEQGVPEEHIINHPSEMTLLMYPHLEQ